MTTGYQPFAITKFQTGQFQYYQPWQSPDDAFVDLENAYVFRGLLQKRAGTSIFGLTGSLRYTNNEVADLGDGGNSYSGTLSNFPLESPITVTARVAGNNISATATGSGPSINWSGPLASGGSININTGVWTLTTNGVVAMDVPIIITYTFTDNLTHTPANPIMMITEFINETSNAHIAVAADIRRFAQFNTITQLFDPVETFSQLVFSANSQGVMTTGPISLGWTNVAPYSVTVTLTLADGYTESMTDVPQAYPNGKFEGTPTYLDTANSSINYSAGTVNIKYFGFAPHPAPVNITITASLQGDYFTGDNTNLFNYVNWRASDQDTAHLYMTNNVDQVTTFDGTNLARPPLGITLAHVNAGVNDIATTLDVKVFAQSLLLIRPTLVGDAFPEGQTIRSSAVQNPTNFAADVPGNGSFIAASTGDWIFAASYLRDDIIVDFEDSTFIFRQTGNKASPFKFIKINSTLATNAPYGSIEYDAITTSMGAKGLCKCDGVNKIRYDVPAAIDIYEDISELNFPIAQGKRFDETQQSWMIYPSSERDPSNTNCDKAIIYNWLESIWSIYNIDLSCIGSAKTYKDVVWNDFAGMTWNEIEFTWNSLVEKDLVPWMLGGDILGKIYYLNNEDAEQDKMPVDPTTAQIEPNSGSIIYSSITSARWNPFVEQGQKATYGYMDFYYRVGRNSYTDDNFPDGKETVVILNWFVNNSNDPALIQSMTLDSPPPTGDETDPEDTDEVYAWKRMYINLTGQFLQLEIQSSSDETEQGQFQFAGMVLWAKPAGRLTPGNFL